MMNNPIHLYDSCRICNSDNIQEVFKLKPTPPGDFFLPKEKLGKSVEKYPLILALCKQCGYLHLPYILDPNISYQNYLYETNFLTLNSATVPFSFVLKDPEILKNFSHVQ